MTPGDRVVVVDTASSRYTAEGELVGWDNAGLARVWFRAEGVTVTFATDRIAVMAPPRRPRSRN